MDNNGEKTEEPYQQPPPYSVPTTETKSAYPTSSPQSSYPQLSGYPQQSGYPQPSGYPQATYPAGSYPASSVTVAAGGVSVGAPHGLRSPLANPPPDYLGWSIFNTCCCCFCFGIAAILKSKDSQSAALAGDESAAIAASNTAKTYNIVSTALGLVFICVYIGVTCLSVGI